MPSEDWSYIRAWAELRTGGRETIAPDLDQRGSIALRFEIESLNSLVAEIEMEAWQDGVRLVGRVDATATRLCGVTLDALTEVVHTDFDVRVVPVGSPNAPAPEAELVVSLDAEDPPDVAPGIGVDLAAYAIEAFSLALDPFPRAPGAMFEYVDPAAETSPFKVLAFLAKSSDDEA